MPIADSTDIIRQYERLGWRVRSGGELAAVTKAFQRAWLLGPVLVMDGITGPKTRAALKVSLDRLDEGKGTASPHFSFHEFDCKCGGRYIDCARVWVHPTLLRSLETLRAKWYPKGLKIISGCRCNSHNKAVGGVVGSQHLLGTAADISGHVSYRRLTGEKLFAGIGFVGSTGLVTHVDRRDVGGRNLTHGATGSPTVWRYAR